MSEKQSSAWYFFACALSYMCSCMRRSYDTNNWIDLCVCECVNILIDEEKRTTATATERRKKHFFRVDLQIIFHSTIEKFMTIEVKKRTATKRQTKPAICLKSILRGRFCFSVVSCVGKSANPFIYSRVRVTKNWQRKKFVVNTSAFDHREEERERKSSNDRTHFDQNIFCLSFA